MNNGSNIENLAVFTFPPKTLFEAEPAFASSKRQCGPVNGRGEAPISEIDLQVINNLLGNYLQ